MNDEHALRPIEIATGLALGHGRRDEIPPAEPARTPLEAIERAIRPALERSPCLVSFSGGRDSSCVLAAATMLARREGLPPPIPATNRFPDAPAADETEWQERVVAALGLSDWLRCDFGDELDAVGPIAQDVLRRHGLLWPFNAHFHVPLLQAASDGSLLTGIGGDEVFGESSWARANAVLARAVPPTPRDVLRVGFLFAPGPLRRAALRRIDPASFPWLTAAGQKAFTSAAAADAAAEPRRYAARLRWWRGLRSAQLGFRSLGLLAADAGVLLVHPLADVSVGAALAEAAPPSGPVERGAFMREVFGDLLPEELYRRRTKAGFNEAFWGRHARAAAARWDGEAADPELVDADALRSVWSEPVPDAHTLTLLQAAWLELDAASRSPRADRRPQPEAGPSPGDGEAPSRASLRA